MANEENASETKKSENVEVTLQRKSHCAIHLDVKASSTIVKNARKKALKEIAKELTIPGFRKGKAPAAIIEKRHGAELTAEWHRQIAREAFREAQEIFDVPAIGSHSQIRFDLKSHSLEEGAHVIFDYEAEPKVPSIDLQKFVLTPYTLPSVEEKEVNEFIYQLRFFFATWNDVSRPIQEGDYIEIDVESLETDPPTKVFSHARFEVSDARMAQWLKKLVLGKTAGEAIEGLSKADSTASDEEKKNFSERRVRVTIHKTQEALLPPIDEVLAKKVGMESVDALFAWSKDHLMQLGKNKQEEEERKQVASFLLSHDFDLPVSLLESEAKDRLETYLKDPQALASWNKLPAEEKSKMEVTVREKSRDAIKLFFLSYHFFRENKMTISQQELHEFVFHMHPEYERVVAKITQNDLQNAVAQLYLRKTEDYILKKAKGENP